MKPMWVLLLSAASSAMSLADERISAMNERFLEALSRAPVEKALAVSTIREGWENEYQRESSESFIPDALAVLYPEYLAALEAFDRGEPEETVRRLEPLLQADDSFLAANALYFYVRAQVDRGLYEEAGKRLTALPETPSIDSYTPLAPRLWFVKAFCEARNLSYDAALATLATLNERFPDASEAVRVGARQLALEIERREKGTVGEVADVMQYVADRVRVEDASDPVKQRQEEILAMLDKLIEENKQKEQQGGGGSGRQSAKGAPGGPSQPNTPRDTSEAPPAGPGSQNLHGAPDAQPSQSWGKLPPAERDKILQRIRERFPSRYRQLVEQYYRSMAEDK